MLVIRVIRFIRRYWKVITPLLLLIAIGAWFGWRYFSQQTVAVQDQAYPSIIVGQTTSSQLTEQLGSPYTSYTTNAYKIQSQKTAKSPYKPDLFYIKDDVVVLKEEYFEPTIYYYAEKDALAKYGQPEKTLYDTRPLDVTTKALLYPGHGVAVFVHEDSQAVAKIQYFSPTSLQDYLKTWGQDLGDKKDIKPFKMEPD